VELFERFLITPISKRLYRYEDIEKRCKSASSSFEICEIKRALSSFPEFSLIIGDRGRRPCGKAGVRRDKGC
jgi:hypothetical protein